MSVTPDDIGNAPVASDATLYERRMKAATLRNAGLTFDQIGKRLGISDAMARKDIHRAYREVLSETVEEMAARQRTVLLDIQRAHYPAVLQGDKDAAGVVLKALEREARLFGLDAPTRVSVGVSDAEFAEQAAALIRAIRPDTLRELTRHGEVIDAEVEEPAGGIKPIDAADTAADLVAGAEPKRDPSEPRRVTKMDGRRKRRKPAESDTDGDPGTNGHHIPPTDADGKPWSNL